MKKTGFLVIILLISLIGQVSCKSRKSEGSQVLSIEQKSQADRVHRVCGRLFSIMTPEERDMIKHLNVSESDTINAYADKEGGVTITTAMLNFVANDDELAVICGHEFAHITLKHFDSIIGNLGTSILVGIATGIVAHQVTDSTDVAVQVGAITASLQNNSFSRKQEHEADYKGMVYAWNAGFNPKAGMTLWQKMATLSKSSGSRDQQRLETYLSTHPLSYDRADFFVTLVSGSCQNGNDDLIPSSLEQCFHIMQQEPFSSSTGEWEEEYNQQGQRR